MLLRKHKSNFIDLTRKDLSGNRNQNHKEIVFYLPPCGDFAVTPVHKFQFIPKIF